MDRPIPASQQRQKKQDEHRYWYALRSKINGIGIGPTAQYQKLAKATLLTPSRRRVDRWAVKLVHAMQRRWSLNA